MNAINPKDKSLPDLRQGIADLVPTLDEKPYSHNLIGILLNRIHNIHGEKEAKKAIKELGLKDLGWE